MLRYIRSCAEGQTAPIPTAKSVPALEPTAAPDQPGGSALGVPPPLAAASATAASGQAAAPSSPLGNEASVVRNLSASLTLQAAEDVDTSGEKNSGGVGSIHDGAAATVAAAFVAGDVDSGGGGIAQHSQSPMSPGNRVRAARSPEHKMLRSRSRLRVTEEIVHRKVGGAWVPCVVRGGEAATAAQEERADQGGHENPVGEDSWPGAGVTSGGAGSR